MIIPCSRVRDTIYKIGKKCVQLVRTSSNRGRTKADAIRSIRDEFTRWGIDTSDISDEELESGLASLGSIMAGSGVTMAEASASIAKIASLGLSQDST